MRYNPKYATDKERIQALANLEAEVEWAKTPDNQILLYKQEPVKRKLKTWQVFALLHELRP